MLESLISLARHAGQAILEVYNADFSVDTKTDASPLTEADRRSHNIIVKGLPSIQNIPIISEESQALPWETRQNWQRCWIVDPLDGTKEFVKKNGEFTVNIALIDQGQPVAAIVLQPVTGIIWAAVDSTAWKILPDDTRHQLTAHPHYAGLKSVRVVGSRSHLSPETEEFVQNLRAEGREVSFLSAGSSLKLCLVAEGLADVYPRYAPTMEWDTAAAQAVAQAAGRQVLAVPGDTPLRYNKENLLNPWFRVE